MWTAEQLQIIQTYYGKEPVEETAKRLGKTARTTTCKACRIGLSTPTSRWKEEEVVYLKEFYTLKPIEEIAKHLGKTYIQVTSKAHLLGIADNKRGQKMGARSQRTKEIEEKIRELFKDHSIKSIADKIGISRILCQKIANRMWLRHHKVHQFKK